jgi:hypothetical protein
MEELFQKKLSTQEKALRINLTKAVYGSFAEIGAGQEVAANFFKVGGASGTIAKTISAYDMKFSDAIYGSGGRYVSEDRLKRMLDHEYALKPSTSNAQTKAKAGWACAFKQVHVANPTSALYT